MVVKGKDIAHAFRFDVVFPYSKDLKSKGNSVPSTFSGSIDVSTMSIQQLKRRWSSWIDGLRRSSSPLFLSYCSIRSFVSNIFIAMASPTQDLQEPLKTPHENAKSQNEATQQTTNRVVVNLSHLPLYSERILYNLVNRGTVWCAIILCLAALFTLVSPPFKNRASKCF